MGERGRRARVGAAGVIALGVMSGVLFGHVDAQPATTAPAVRPAPHRVLRLAPHESRARHVFHGVVRPRERAMLAFTEGGRLETRPAEVGDRVRRGDVLAALDRRGYGHAVRAARATTAELEARGDQLARDRRRASVLAADGVTPQAQLEQVSSGYRQVTAQQQAAAANLAESRRRRAEATLRAPFDGVVTDVLAEPTELVAAGQPILRLAGADGHEVVLQVSAELALSLAPGQPVALAASGLEPDDPLARRALEGVVRAVVPDAAGLEGLFPVIVDVSPDPAVRAGLGVEAVLDGPAREVLRVPLAAILDPSGRRPFVWRAVDGVAERAWIRTGRLEDGWVEVREGLSPGDTVVVHGHTRLLPGDAVRTGA